jgi:hypothetical protein
LGVARAGAKLTTSFAREEVELDSRCQVLRPVGQPDLTGRL